MKKIILLLSVGFLLALSINAQRVAPTITQATLTNAQTGYVTANPVTSTFYESIAFQVTLTKTSGTIAGTAVLQGTVNGSTWTNITSTALTDATTTYLFSDVPAKYYQYRVAVATTGTSVSTISSSYYLLKGRR